MEGNKQTERKKARSRAEILHERRYREVRREFAEGKMPLLLRRYLAFCGVDGNEVPYDSEEGAVKRSSSAGRAPRGRIPNPAGFCRFLELERDAYKRLEAEFPTEAGRMRAVFEDEALNAEMPASVLGFYLKYLLTEEAETIPTEGREGGEVIVAFQHDILADGR